MVEFTMKILYSDSSPEIEKLREKTNYAFSRALAKIIYYLFTLLCLAVIVLSPFSLLGFGTLYDVIPTVIGGLVGFFVTKIFYESFSVILDIGDATVANLSKTNTTNTSIDSSAFSSVVDELKKISEQNKEQAEALKKSIEELSEKAENTNTYLYHIYKK
jgi:hypothetical protein